MTTLIITDILRDTERFKVSTRYFYLILIEIITLTFPGYSSSSPSMRESKDFTVPRDNLDFTVPRDNLGAHL